MSTLRRVSRPWCLHLSPAEPVLLLRHLKVARGEDWAVHLDEIVLRAGETAALVGPSGCGKTTLLLGWTGLFPGLSVAGEREVLGAAWPEVDTPEWSGMLAEHVTILMQKQHGALRLITGLMTDQKKMKARIFWPTG